MAAKENGKSKEAVAVLDSWQNILTSVGTRNDPGSYTRFVGDALLSHSTLTDIYASEGLAARIVDLYSDGMVRRWLSEAEEGGAQAIEALEELDAKHHFGHALRWSGLYGGAIMLVSTRGQNHEDPLRIGAQVERLTVFDRGRVTRQEELDAWEIGTPGKTFLAHDSRVIVFDGLPTPADARANNGGWGLSRVQRAAESLRRYGEGRASVSQILRDFILPILKMGHLATSLAAGNEDAVIERMRMIQLSRSVINMVAIDAEHDDYEKLSSNVAGIDSLLDEFKFHVAAVTGIPQSLLFGRGPQGMNATGEYDARSFAETLQGEQERALWPQLCRLLRIMGFDPATVQLVPLVEEDRKTRAEVDDLRASTIQKHAGIITQLLTVGVIDDDEARAYLREYGVIDGD